MGHCCDMRERNEEVSAKWRSLIAEQSRSGQTVVAFCGGRNIRQWQFFAWKKRLRQAAAKQFVEVQVVGQPPTPASSGSGPAIEIRLACGRRVFVEPGFDAEHLHAVLAALEMRA
jgi:hypothetical protein